MTGDPYNLLRFVDAQRDTYEEARRELANGRKTGHWIWFIFPQLHGLGRSEMAAFYGISGREEAAAYLAHPVLGPRLKECAGLMNGIEGRPAEDVLGGVDAMKFRSSMTLFAAVAQGDRVFQDALEKYFDGKPDPLTIQGL